MTFVLNGSVSRLHFFLRVFNPSDHVEGLLRVIRILVPQDTFTTVQRVLGTDELTFES